MTSTFVDTSDVEDMLFDVMAALGPAGLSSFMALRMTPWLQHRAEDRFVEEGDDASGRWGPLMASTIERRERAGYGGAHPINVRTGEMEAFITGAIGQAISTPEGVTLVYPSEEPDGKLYDKVLYAQEGRGGNHQGTPRPVLAIGETDVLEMQTALMLFIQEAAMGNSSVARSIRARSQPRGSGGQWI